VVAAFLAGFSERYFLRVLDKAGESTETSRETSTANVSPDPSPARASADLSLITSD
jgi:hypothetical protein